jgi:hypothetical protein
MTDCSVMTPPGYWRCQVRHVPSQTGQACPGADIAALALGARPALVAEVRSTPAVLPPGRFRPARN